MTWSVMERITWLKIARSLSYICFFSILFLLQQISLPYPIKQWSSKLATALIWLVREWVNCRWFQRSNGVAKDVTCRQRPSRRPQHPTATQHETQPANTTTARLLPSNWSNMITTPLSFGTTKNACHSTRKPTLFNSFQFAITITASTPVWSTNDVARTPSSTSSSKVRKENCVSVVVVVIIVSSTTGIDWRWIIYIASDWLMAGEQLVQSKHGVTGGRMWCPRPLLSYPAVLRSTGCVVPMVIEIGKVKVELMSSILILTDNAHLSASRPQIRSQHSSSPYHPEQS